jgi:hypothetical protein
MPDETALKMYESARDRLRELIRQEAEIKDQISHWGPVVEQLARLTGEAVKASGGRRRRSCRGGAGDGADGGDPVGVPAAVAAAPDANPG